MKKCKSFKFIFNVLDLLDQNLITLRLKYIESILVFSG